MQTEIAVDVDSTLAATSDVAFDLLEGEGHDHSYDDIESWDWGPKKWGQPYLDAMWHAWTLRPEEIEPMSPLAVPRTNDLSAKSYYVDIVTTQPDREGITANKKEWLDWHDVRYDMFEPVPMKTSKVSLAYDVYVDDNPNLADEVRGTGSVMFLIDQPYNQHVEEDGNIFRVDTVPTIEHIEEHAWPIQK